MPIRKVMFVLGAYAVLFIGAFLGGAIISEMNDSQSPAPVTPQPTRDEVDGRDNPIPNTRMPIPTVSPMVNTVTPIPTFSIDEITRNGIAESDSVTMRACPYIACAQVSQASRGIPFLVTGIVAEGEGIEGVTEWYRVEYRGETVYVHSSFVNLVEDELSLGEGAGVVLTVTPPQWDCSRDMYNCSAFDNRVTLMSYFNACPGDPSRLDRNNDGVPCESIP